MVPEQEPKPILSLGPFFGQISTLARYYVPPNYAVKASFMETRNTFGALKSPPGRLLQWTSPFTVTGLGRFYVVGSSPYLLVSANNNGTPMLYYTNNSGIPAITLNSNISLPVGWNPAPIFFTQYANYMFITNGKNAPQKIDSNLNLTAVGIAGPTTWTASSLAVGSSSPANQLPLGQYTYMFTWQTATQESTPLPAAQWQTITTNDAGGDAITITNIPQPSANSGVAQINIYRIGGVLGDAFRLVTSVSPVAQGGSSTYTDNTADGNPSASGSSLSTATILFQQAIYGGGTSNAQDVPLNFTRLVPFENAMWGYQPQSDTSKLSPGGWMYRSGTNAPESWNVNNAIPCDPNDGDTIQRALGFGTFLIVWKYGSFGVITGSNMQDYQWMRLEESGCIAPNSPAITPDGALFLSSDGLRCWNGLTGSQIFSAKVNDTIQAYSISDRQAAVGFYSQDLYSYFLSFPTLGITYQFNFLSRQISTLPFASDYALVLSKFNDPHIVIGTTGQASTSIDGWFNNTSGDSHGTPTLDYLTDRILIAPEKVFQVDYMVAYFDLTSGDFSITVTWDGDTVRQETHNFRVSLARDPSGNIKNYIFWHPTSLLQGSDCQIEIKGLDTAHPPIIYGFKVWGHEERDMLP